MNKINIHEFAKNHKDEKLTFDGFDGGSFSYFITLYRAMCQEEYNSVSNDTPFVWHSKAKWFTDDLTFIQERVLDGKFNNSSDRPKRYTHLVKYELENLNGFSRVSNNELMLKRKDVPLTLVKQVIKLGAVA